MNFSENPFPVFRIMLQSTLKLTVPAAQMNPFPADACFALAHGRTALALLPPKYRDHHRSPQG
jgi:hypothetical protein